MAKVFGSCLNVSFWLFRKVLGPLALMAAKTNRVLHGPPLQHNLKPLAPLVALNRVDKGWGMIKVVIVSRGGRSAYIPPRPLVRCVSYD